MRGRVDGGWRPAAVGLRAHSGWAALVALGGPADSPSVVSRRRLEMEDGSLAGARQPYHAAEELELRAAQALLARCAGQAELLAWRSLHEVVDGLAAGGHRVVAGVVLMAANRPLPPLRAILASHALIHTADGEHFRAALRAAAARGGLAVSGVAERDVYENAAKALGLEEDVLIQRVAAFRKAVGPPWTQDEKLAAAAAWLALAPGPRAKGRPG